MDEIICYLAVSPASYGFAGYYGTGKTVDEARGNAKRHGGTYNKMVVYRIPAGVTSAHVDDFGTIRFNFATPERAQQWRGLPAADQQLEIVHRRGFPAAVAANI